MKLHIGCGTVYLLGWTNMDLPGPDTFLVDERPDLVEKWGTTEEAYYAKHADKTMDTLRAGPLNQEMVCDTYGSFDNIPLTYWQCEHVLARQVFEHLSISEAHRALDQVDGVMKSGGILTLDVPDSEATLEEYRRTGDPFFKRHFLGPRRNDNGYHLPYTRETLRTLVEEHGFIFEAEEPNIHFFPAFTLRFRKPGPRAPYEYVDLPSMPDHWKVLDVGPGEYPLPRADVYLDYDRDKLAPLKLPGKSTILADIQHQCWEIPNKAFDFVYASHCMEHFADPVAAAATISRIGKRGCMIVPSAWKESLTNFEESGHLWQVLPNPRKAEPPIFVRTNGQVDQIRHVDTMKSMSRLFRTGPNRISEEQRQLRKWWYQHEAALDVVHFWEGELKVQMIG